MAWTVSPPGTKQRSHRCPWSSSLPIDSGQSSLLQGWERENSRSLPAPGPLHPLQLRPSNPRPSPFPAITGSPAWQSLSSEHMPSGMPSRCQERKVPAWGPPAQGHVPPRGRGGVPPWPEPHTLGEPAPFPVNAGTRTSAYRLQGPLEHTDTPASGKGLTPPEPAALPRSPLLSTPNRTSAQVLCRWLAVTIRLVITKKTLSP